jgi:hypothetical protein
VVVSIPLSENMLNIKDIFYEFEKLFSFSIVELSNSKL